MEKTNEVYIGDGCYASDNGYMFILRAPRENGDHWIGLEPEVIESFIRYIAKQRKLKITVDRLSELEAELNDH